MIFRVGERMEKWKFAGKLIQFFTKKLEVFIIKKMYILFAFASLLYPTKIVT